MQMKNQLNEIRSLIDRMENPRTGWGSIINENLNEVSTKWRQVTGPEEFYDILTGVKDGSKVTFGYITAAKIVVPKGSFINPQTNRKNSFDDYEQLGKNLGVEGKLTGVIKLAIYNINWQTESKVNQQYSNWKTTRDNLGQKYGLDFKKAAYKTQNLNFGTTGGISSYNGNNAENLGHTYTNLNTYGIKPMKTLYYLVMDDGSLQPIDETRLEKQPYKSSVSAIDKLIAAGATEQEVSPLREMNYQRFEHSHLLFFSATPTEGSNAGLPSLFINTKLSEKLGRFTAANTTDIINLAKERYSQFTGFKTDTQETPTL